MTENNIRCCYRRLVVLLTLVVIGFQPSRAPLVVVCVVVATSSYSRWKERVVLENRLSHIILKSNYVFLSAAWRHLTSLVVLKHAVPSRSRSTRAVLSNYSDAMYSVAPSRCIWCVIKGMFYEGISWIRSRSVRKNSTAAANAVTID